MKGEGGRWKGKGVDGRERGRRKGKGVDGRGKG